MGLPGVLMSYNKVSMMMVGLINVCLVAVEYVQRKELIAPMSGNARVLQTRLIRRMKPGVS